MRFPTRQLCTAAAAVPLRGHAWQSGAWPEVALGRVTRARESVSAAARRAGWRARQGSAHSERARAPGSAREAPSCGRGSSRCPATWRSPAWAWARRRRPRWPPRWTPSCTARPASRLTRPSRRCSRPTTRCAGGQRGDPAVHMMYIPVHAGCHCVNQEGFYSIPDALVCTHACPDCLQCSWSCHGVGAVVVPRAAGCQRRCRGPVALGCCSRRK